MHPKVAPVWGLRLAGGRSRRAAPLERLDVPPAGLSGRSRSCPNRSPWQPAQAPELPGWESSAGCRGCRCPSAGCAAPAMGGIALRPGHGTPWQDAAPLEASFPLCCHKGAGVRGQALGQVPWTVPRLPGSGKGCAVQPHAVPCLLGREPRVLVRHSRWGSGLGVLCPCRALLCPPRAVVAAAEQGEEQGPAPGSAASTRAHRTESVRWLALSWGPGRSGHPRGAVGQG